MNDNYKGRGQSITQQLVVLAAPMVFSNLAYTILGVIDMVFLGRVSTIAIGAGGVASSLFLTFSLLFRGTINGAMPYVSRMYGGNDRVAAGRYLQYFLVLSLLISPIVALLPWAVQLYFAIVRPNPEIAAQARLYINIRLLELPFSLIMSAVSSFMIGIGNSRTPMILSWLAVLVNIGANYVLIFGKLGFPALGIAGAAWGTVFAVFVQTVVGLIIVRRKYSREYALTKWSLPSVADLKAMIRVGLPIGVTDAVEVGSFTTFFALISRLGTTELAASQIANQISGLAFMPGFALGAATGSLIGRYMGANKLTTAEQVGYRGAMIGVGTMSVVGVGFWVFSSQLGRIFTTDLEVLRMTSILLRVMAFYQIFDAANIVFRGALNGAGDTRFTMLAIIGCSAGLFIPGVYVFTFTLNLGLIGAWLGCILYLVSLAVLSMMRFRSGRWKHIRLTTVSSAVVSQ